MSFDEKTFEALFGMDLANYAVRLMQGNIAEADFLPYFETKAATMDPPHLELAVGILGRIGTESAYRKVTEFLEHPNFNVRFVATKTIAHMVVADETIMRCVVESLSLHANDPAALAQELRGVLNRPSNEKAKRIASEYRSRCETA